MSHYYYYHFCLLPANKMLLDQNWAQEDVGPDLNQNCLTLIRGTYCYYCQLITSAYSLDPDQAGQIIIGLEWIEAV